MSQGKEHPMVPVPEAIRIVLRETARVCCQPTLHPRMLTEALEDLLDRTLEEDVLMKEPGYPPYNASIMDGYAIRTADCRTSDQSDDWTHQVVDKVYAGDEAAPQTSQQPSRGNLPAAYYITTGAVVPDVCDCVVPIEECQVSQDKTSIRIQTSAAIQPSKWIRPIGCDIPAGSVVLPKGHLIDPVALGLIKQSGADEVVIRRQLKVGVLSTGNELILGSKDASVPGKIPDVNRPILLNLLKTFGNYCQTLDLGNERDDDVQAMAKTIQQALEKCDVVITTGGISMGETDIVEQVLVEQCGGTLHFGRMNMKPGKPTTFVTIPKGDSTRLVFAMPGNPVSATVCTQLLVKPCLDLLYHGIDPSIPPPQGGDIPLNILNQIVNHALVHQEIEASLAHDIKLDQGRPEYHRVTVSKSPDASYQVSTTGVQRSSRLMSCRDAQALLVLPVGTTSKPKALAGEKYPVILLDDLRGINQLQVKQSKHLIKRARACKVAVVEVVPSDKVEILDLETTCKRVQEALSGQKSGEALIVSKKIFSEDDLDQLYSTIVDSNEADVVVICCPSFKGSYCFHLDIAAMLRQKLSKIANAMALQARQGAAMEDPIAGLFEVVVGYAPENQGATVISLPRSGVAGGLGNVRGLLKHSVNVGRGKPHNHHHTHGQHDHSKSQ